MDGDTGPAPEPDPAGEAGLSVLAADGARRVLQAHWDPVHRYCAPSRTRYRWQWLWDSCFHAVVWASLGDERAVDELRALFALQAPSGFVPHLGYQADPEAARPLWGRPGASTITQPPMWGHALAVLASQGMAVDDLVAPATAGLRFVLDHRRDRSGLLRIVHPWETGADDSPRWDTWCPGGFDRQRWLQWKLRAVASLRHHPDGGAVANPAFEVCPASFNALVAFNAAELGALANDDGLRAAAAELGQLVADGWDPAPGTWVDGAAGGGRGAGDDTLDAQLAVLVDRDPARGTVVGAALGDTDRFGAPFGPCALSRSHPAFDPRSYWRGPSWPQLTYLLWVALDRSGQADAARALAVTARRTAVTSGFAEYADPFTGEGLGAVPQSWAGLCAVPPP